MTTSSQLDALIRGARRSEDPSPQDRAVVRRAVELRITGALVAVPDDTSLERAVLRPARGPRRAAARLSMSTGLLPALVLSVLAGVTADVSSAERAPLEPTALSAAVPASSESPAAETEMARGAESVPNAAAPALGSAAVPRAALERAAVPGAAAQRRAGAPAPVAKVAADTANLAAESRALAAVQRALRDGEHEAALRLLDEQDRTFARGVLGEERAAARVIGRCRAGRTLQAERARAAFEARYPRSPLLARLETACSPGAAP